MQCDHSVNIFSHWVHPSLKVLLLTRPYCSWHGVSNNKINKQTKLQTLATKRMLVFVVLFVCLFC